MVKISAVSIAAPSPIIYSFLVALCMYLTSGVCSNIPETIFWTGVWGIVRVILLIFLPIWWGWTCWGPGCISQGLISGLFWGACSRRSASSWIGVFLWRGGLLACLFWPRFIMVRLGHGRFWTFLWRCCVLLRSCWKVWANAWRSPHSWCRRLVSRCFTRLIFVLFWGKGSVLRHLFDLLYWGGISSRLISQCFVLLELAMRSCLCLFWWKGRWLRALVSLWSFSGRK